MNKYSPKTEPCGIPKVIIVCFDILPSYLPIFFK